MENLLSNYICQYGIFTLEENKTAPECMSRKQSFSSRKSTESYTDKGVSHGLKW